MCGPTFCGMNRGWKGGRPRVHPHGTRVARVARHVRRGGSPKAISVPVGEFGEAVSLVVWFNMMRRMVVAGRGLQ